MENSLGFLKSQREYKKEGEESEQERGGEEAVRVGRGWRGKKEERRRNR